MMKMGEEVREEPVVAKPVKVELCDHKGKLEAVSAVVVELPPIIERKNNIFRCNVCGAVVVTNKD